MYLMHIIENCSSNWQTYHFLNVIFNFLSLKTYEVIESIRYKFGGLRLCLFVAFVAKLRSTILYSQKSKFFWQSNKLS